MFGADYKKLWSPLLKLSIIYNIRAGIEDNLTFSLKFCIPVYCGNFFYEKYLKNDHGQIKIKEMNSSLFFPAS
jgi:hypothetical protein